MSKAGLLLALLFPGVAQAFPELVRYGYVSCTLCHINPNGGGVINSFGRAISGVALSTWSKDSESAFAYGAVTPARWLTLGGDARAVQVYKNSPAVREGRFIVMQSDVEAAAQIKKWTVDATLGVQPLSNFQLLSRRHFVSYRPRPDWVFQAGRFSQAFGINTPDHVIATKRGLNWDEGTETYNFQAAWLKENHDVFLTLNFGRPDGSGLERGIALRGRYYWNHNSRLGMSYFYGGNAEQVRHVFGPSAEIGLSTRTFILFEADFQKQFPIGAPSQWGAVNYLRFDHEWVQGFHTYLTQEFSQLDFTDPTSVNFAFGLGVQFFPRPHFELNTSWQRRKILSSSTDFQDFAWFMMHFYL